MSSISNPDEVTRALRGVRQTRQYTPEPVADDLVTELLQIARWTGSSRNTQPWHFIAITDKELLRQISQLRPPINWVGDAPLAIAIVLDGDAALSEAYDEGRVTERLMIGAHVLGLHSGVAWYGDDAQQAEAKRLLNIPAERTARSVVAIGHATTSADPRPNPAQGGRRPLDEVVSYDRMGS
ncbi:MAG TPA: nitroreductase family protein [Thermomicrobiales bacterium]|nr:nitroreductase family protein [Thermomicrobiales bacterium]